MARRSTVDHHRARQAIEEALARGTPVRLVAERFGLAKSSVQRHKERMARVMAGAPTAGETGADELLAKVRRLQGEAEAILEKSRRAGDDKTALAAIKEARSGLELLAKMVGELQTGTSVNITVSTQWIELRADLMTALEPFPEARVAVMHALEGHESGD